MGLGAQSHGSGCVPPLLLLPPLGHGLNSESWPWRHSCGGLGRASESKPALAPATQMPQKAEGSRSMHILELCHPVNHFIHRQCVPGLKWR